MRAKASANSKDSINKTIATVATTLEQLKSKDADDAQVGYEAVSATQDVNFTAAVGEGPLNPSPDDTCQITATWTYPQVKDQGVDAAKFNKDMVQLVADTLDASKQASMDDEDSRVTMMYTAEIVSIGGDIACVRTYTDSYQPPYRSERVTRSAYYNLKTGEQVSLEDSLVQHGLSLTPSRVRPSRQLRRQSRILTLRPKATSTMTIPTLGIISTTMARAISSSSILASLTAWHGICTTWLRTPSIRAIPAVRTLRPCEPRLHTCPTSRVRRQGVI